MAGNAATSSAHSLMGLFRTTHGLIPLVLGDLTPIDARKRTREGKGPSVAWIVGHLLHYRYTVLNLLGVETASPFAEQFGSASATDGNDYPSLAELRGQWDDVHGKLEAAMGNASPAVLERPSTQPGAHGEKTVLDSLVFFAWHEAYHMGALGAVRKDLAYPGPAELVMAAARSGS